MSRDAQDIARDARTMFRAKYGDDMDVVDAFDIVEQALLHSPGLKGKYRERAIDALNFVSLAWNVEVPEDEEE